MENEIHQDQGQTAPDPETTIDQEYAEFEREVGGSGFAPKLLTDEQVKKIDAIRKSADIIGMNKQFGDGTIRVYGESFVRANTEFISTQIFSLDMILGGGMPTGRIIELYGPEGSGKTTIALTTVASAMEKGEVCGYIDAEHAIDMPRLMQLGVNPNAMFINQPDYGEQGLSAAEMLVENNCKVIVVDSVAALTPKAELDGDMGDSHVGLQARMMGQAMRRLKAAVAKKGACVIFINQIREKVGVMFGSPETTPGGRALKFFADIRMVVRRLSSIKSAGDLVVGQTCTVETKKNKLTPPFQKCEFNLYYDSRGVDRREQLIGAAIQMNIIHKSGSWLLIPIDSDVFPDLRGQNLGQGAKAAMDRLEQDKQLLDRLFKAVTETAINARKKQIEMLSDLYRLDQASPTRETSDEEGLRQAGERRKKRSAKGDK